MLAPSAQTAQRVFDEPIPQAVLPGEEPVQDDHYERSKLVQEVNSNFVQGVSYREPWIEDGLTAVDFYENRQWPNTQKTKKKIQITINRIKPALDNTMSLISKTKTLVAIEGVGPEDAIKGKIIDQLFDDVTRKDQTEFKFHRCIKDSRKRGLGVGKEIWNVEVEPPFGLPEYQVLRPDEIVVQPGACGMQFEDADWIIHQKRVSTLKLQSMYPEHKDAIQPDSDWLRNTSRTMWYSAYSAVDMTSRARGSADTLAEIPRSSISTVKEMWYKVFEPFSEFYAARRLSLIVPSAPGGPMGPQSIQSSVVQVGQKIDSKIVQALGLKPDQDVTELRFARTKIRVATVINDVLISDIPSPFEHGRFPFVFFKGNEREDYSYPDGDIIFAVELQEVINKLHSLNLDQLVRSNYSPIVADKGSLTPELEQVLGKYGYTSAQLLSPKRGARLDRLQPPQGTQEAFLLLLRQLSQSFDELMGFHDIDRGDSPYATSGKGLEELRLSSEAFHSPKSNPIQQALLWWATMRVSNIQYLMPQEMAVRIDERLAKDIDGTPHRAFMTPGQGGNPAFYAANKMGMVPDPETGAYVPWKLNDLSVGKFDVKATLIPDYLASKKSKAEIFIALRKMQDVRRIDVLEALDVPNADEINKEMDQENSLLQLGKKVAEDPVLMAMQQDPAIRAQVEEYLKARQGATGPPGPGGAPPGGPPAAPVPAPAPQGVPA